MSFICSALRVATVAAVLALNGCTAEKPHENAVDEVSFLQDIADPVSDGGDPFTKLEGQWAIETVGDTAFPANVGIVNFQSKDFFSHEAGCGGGHPAFYEASPNGDLSTSRREPVVIGKCSSSQAASLEKLLTDFLDRANRWALNQDGALVLIAADGTRAVLRRPEGPRPVLQGEWRVLSIGGSAWDGPQPARITISYNYIGAGAGCNSGGASYASPEPGRLVLDSLPTTLTRCEDALMQAEAQLFHALRTVTKYQFDSDRLILTGSQQLELERAPG